MIAVTNRHLCKRDFLEQIGNLAADDRIEAIILREKDMSEGDYRELAKKVLACCGLYHKKCILHTFISVARGLHCPYIHLPYSVFLKSMGQVKTMGFQEIGTSVHSVEDAMKAEHLGATYLIAGHVFDTDCKKGLPGRGVEFLREVCRSVTVPVYGIGGITPQNLPQVLETGAKGGCSMSLAMGQR